eukprot:2755496-Rhodomonas_salina.1
MLGRRVQHKTADTHVKAAHRITTGYPPSHSIITLHHSPTRHTMAETASIHTSVLFLALAVSVLIVSITGHAEVIFWGRRNKGRTRTLQSWVDAWHSSTSRHPAESSFASPPVRRMIAFKFLPAHDNPPTPLDVLISTEIDPSRPAKLAGSATPSAIVTYVPQGPSDPPEASESKLMGSPPTRTDVIYSLASLKSIISTLMVMRGLYAG